MADTPKFDPDDFMAQRRQAPVQSRGDGPSAFDPDAFMASRSGESAAEKKPGSPSIMDRIGDTVGFQNILHGVDDFGNSVRDVFTGGNGSAKLPMSERLGNAVSSIPVVGQPLTESAHALARLSGVESQVPGGSAGRDALRAIPIVGPIAQQPVEDVAAGRNVEGLSNLAMIGLGLAGRGNGMRVSKPLQYADEKLGPGLSVAGRESRLPAIHPALKTAAEWTLPIPHGVLRLAGHGYDLMRNAGARPPRTSETRVFDMGVSPDIARPLDATPVEYSPSGSFGRGVQPGFGPSPNSQPQPIEVGGAHIPEKPYMYPLTQPGEETQMFRQATPHDPYRDLMERMQSSPRRGSVMPSGFGPSPNTLTIPQINSRSLPEGVASIQSIVPTEESQAIPTPLTMPKTAAAAASAGGAAPDYSDITSQYKASRSRARFDANGKRIGG